MFHVLFFSSLVFDLASFDVFFPDFDVADCRHCMLCTIASSQSFLVQHSFIVITCRYDEAPVEIINFL